MRKEVRKLCGTYNLSATFSEDTSSLELLKTPGLIAIRCILSKDGRPVGIGYGSSVITRINKGIERSIFGCLNGALMSAVNSACKTLDALRLEESPDAHEAFRSYDSATSEPATDKQRKYLAELIALNVHDEEEREKRQAGIGDLTKSEASRMIESFRR